MAALAIIQQASGLFLAVILSGAAVNGFYNPPSNDESRWLKLFSHPSICAIKLYLALAILIPVIGISYFSSVCLTLIILCVGVYQNLSAKSGCMCFGQTMAISKRASLVLHLIGLICCFILLGLEPIAPTYSSIIIFALFSAGLFLFIGILNTKPKAPQTKKLPPTLPLDFLLGEDELGRPWTLKELIQAERPLFLVGLHSNCKVCKGLIPDLQSFAIGFRGQFPMVVVSDILDYMEIPTETSLKVLVDPSQALYHTLATNAFPFAILVNGSDGRVMSLPARGDQGIRSLFAIMLSARVPDKK